MAKIMNRRKRVVTLVAAAGLTVAGTGVAFAYWTALGEGEGTATTGESVAFEITSTTAGEDLYPGGPEQTVSFTVSNPSEGPQTLTGVAVRVANDDGSTWTAEAGCSAADFEVAISTPPTYGPIAGGASLTGGEATVTMLNSATNQDGCKSVDVPLYFSATAPVAAPAN